MLWQHLKRLKLEGRHFRRQVAIDGFIADFACHYPKLIIELDGGQHGDAVQYDAERSRILEAHGYRVIRFWNNDVLQAIEGVVDRIRYEVKLSTTFAYTHLQDHPTPTPALPARGGRRWRLEYHGRPSFQFCWH